MALRRCFILSSMLFGFWFGRMNSRWKDRFSWETIIQGMFIVKISRETPLLGPSDSDSPISLLTALELEKIFDDFGSNLSISPKVIKNIGSVTKNVHSSRLER